MTERISADNISLSQLEELAPQVEAGHVLAWTINPENPIGIVSETNNYQDTNAALRNFIDRSWKNLPQNSENDTLKNSVTPAIFRDILKLSYSGIDIEIFDTENNAWIVVPHKRKKSSIPSQISLVVREPGKFLTRFILLAADAQKRENLEPWYKYADINNLFRNATLKDFADPLIFLEKQSYQARNNPFSHMQEWTKIGSIPAMTEDILVKYQHSRSGMESPHEFHIATASFGPTEADELPSVRYGIVSKDTAVVYAVQMPLIENESAYSAKESQRILDEGAPAQIQHIAKFIKNNPREVKRVLGYTPNDSYNADEQFVAFTQYIGEKFPQLSGDEVYKFMTQRLKEIKKNSPVQLRKETLQIQNDVITQTLSAITLVYIYKTTERLNNTFDFRAERMKRSSGFFATERKAKSPDRNIPSGPTFSLAMFCIEAHAKGVRKIEIPTYFPLRMHTNPRTDSRILEQLGQTVASVSTMIDGITQTSFGEEDGSMYLILSDNLSSNNPILNDVIQAHTMHTG